MTTVESHAFALQFYRLLVPSGEAPGVGQPLVSPQGAFSLQRFADAIRNTQERLGSPLVMVFSPHPDDECITGLLPLRLQMESGFEVMNVAITLGSDPARRTARLGELHAACTCLGWRLSLPDARPLPRRNSQEWAFRVLSLTSLIRAERPSLLVFPHLQDRHPTHIAVHHLMKDVLNALPEGLRPLSILSEYWQPNPDANLFVPASVPDVALLVEALCHHHGEVIRNPYHRTLPAWMADAARRGRELIGGFGSADGPPAAFATLYRTEDAFLEPILSFRSTVGH